MERKLIPIKERKVKLMPPRESKPLDLQTRRLFESLEKTREEQRNLNFQNWLKMENEDWGPNTRFILWFLDEIKIILKHYKYDITDEKRFKDEIATFIYNLSTH